MENSIEQYFNHTRTNEFDKLVEEFVTENGTSPFVNVEVKDEQTGELQIDMETNFNKQVEETFGTELDEILGDYFIAVMLDMMAENAENYQD